MIGSEIKPLLLNVPPPPSDVQGPNAEPIMQKKRMDSRYRSTSKHSLVRDESRPMMANAPTMPVPKYKPVRDY